MTQTVEWIITPHVGIGPMLLGATRQALRTAMEDQGFGLESSHANMDHFSKACSAVEYDDSGCAQHIGIFFDERIIPTFRGKDVFGISAREFFALVAQVDQSGEHPFARAQYVFPNQIITLYDAASQYNYRKRGRDAVWMQVGIGNREYLRLIQALAADA